MLVVFFKKRVVSTKEVGDDGKRSGKHRSLFVPVL